MPNTRLVNNTINRLIKRVEALEGAIKTHRSQKADDRCIEDDDRLYEVLGDGIKCDRRVGSKAEMLKNCARFIDRRCEQGHWQTYQEMEAERDALKADLERVAKDRDATLESVVLVTERTHGIAKERDELAALRSASQGAGADLIDALLVADRDPRWRSGSGVNVEILCTRLESARSALEQRIASGDRALAVLEQARGATRDLIDAFRTAAQTSVAHGAGVVERYQETLAALEARISEGDRAREPLSAIAQSFCDRFSSGAGLDWSDVETLFDELIRRGLLKEGAS